MYTGLVIEELLMLVKRAEEHATHARRSLDSASDARLLRQPGCKFSQDNSLLAGVA